ncbi:MAG: dihydropteroate synthase [Acidobacteria bacterium]|jgi:dihydropteroate synthase|nr:dihydropteroate synthase [Acidobacteriota bacterium]
MFWQTSRRKLTLKKTLVMAILNVTPDSFSDGGNFFSIDDALKQAEQLIEEGADILDIGGESTRPNSARVSTEEEIRRVVPIIEAIAKRFNVPISVDTSKAAVAEKAIEAGAEVINDISGLRFDERIAEVAARTNAGLVLMHSRGEFELMHKQMPVENILREVSEGLKWSIEKAKVYGVKKENIALDVGIGFSKTFEQNLELIAKLNQFCQEFSDYPILIGTSRKSFIGKILGDVSTDERLQGSLASAAIAVWNGANIVRVHDVKATVETLKIVDIIKERAGISNPVS